MLHTYVIPGLSAGGILISLALSFYVQSELFKTVGINNGTETIVVKKMMSQASIDDQFHSMSDAITIARNNTQKVDQEIVKMTGERLKKYKFDMSFINSLIGVIKQDLADLLPPPKSCETALTNGVYKFVYYDTPKNAYCENGWMVIQVNKHLEPQFAYDPAYYHAGVGDDRWFRSSFFYSLSDINKITTAKSCKLRVEVWDKHDYMTYAEYSTFSVGSWPRQELTVAGYSGTAGDGLTEGPPDKIHNGMAFSGEDEDDYDRKTNGSCAAENGHVPWWYNNCFDSNLNLPYGSLVWDGRKVKSSRMLIQCSER